MDQDAKTLVNKEPDTDYLDTTRIKRAYQPLCSTVPFTSALTEKQVPKSGSIYSLALIVLGGTFEFSTLKIELLVKDLTVLTKSVQLS